MSRPPGIALLTVGFGAGLATGLAHLTDPVFVTLLLLVLIAFAWRAWWLPIVPAFCIGLGAGAHAAHVASSSCAARLTLGEQQLHVRAIDPAEGTGRVTIASAQCSGTVLARWPRTSHIGAGKSLVVTARWTPAERALRRPDGMLLVSVIDSVRGTPGPIESLRTSIVRATHQLYASRAPLANALLAGWRGELDPDLRAAFASAGLMHLLAISGLHVACLAGWVFLLLRLARVSQHPAEALAGVAALAYCAFLGWPPAAVRASALLLVVAFCRWRQRQVRFTALLAASALITLLVEPWAIVEPGTWLSVAGVSGVVGAIRWTDRAIGTTWWIRSLSGSTGALIATAPFAAATFGQVAPIGIVLNVVGAPLLVLLLPALATSLLLHAIIPPLGASIAASGNGMLALLELLARFGSRAPGGAAAGATGWAAALPWIIVLAATTWATFGSTTAIEAARRLAWSGVAVLAVTLAIPRATAIENDHGLTLLFLDVGQGDGALIRTPLGHWIEVDAGPIGEGRDAGRRVIAPLLAQQGVGRIDLFVLSHAHRDHVGGGAGVLERTPIALAIEPGELFADSAYDNWLAALATHHARWRAARAGAHWTIDGVAFRVLHPPTPWERQGEDLNEDSIVLEVTYGEFRALLMGDAGFVAEGAMADELEAVNVLKVGHHGSRTASSAEFLARVRPQAAIVSVGRNNYGHPAPETLQRLGGAGAGVWRTDMEGTVSVTTDGKVFAVKGARSAATFGTSH